MAPLSRRWKRFGAREAVISDDIQKQTKKLSEYVSGIAFFLPFRTSGK